MLRLSSVDDVFTLMSLFSAHCFREVFSGSLWQEIVHRRGHANVMKSRTSKYLSCKLVLESKCHEHLIG